MDNFPQKNLTAKILALIFAIILWVYVMNEQNPPIDISMQVPLEVRNVVAGHTVRDAADSVRVKIRGPRSVIAVLNNQDVKAYIDLSGVSEGRQTVKVRTAIPNGLDIVDINPDRITLQLDKNVSRSFPIDVTFSGTTTDGANISKVFPEANTVVIEGPRTLIDTVARVVAHVDLTGKTGDFSANIPLVPLNNDGKEVEGIKVSPTHISITTSLVPGPNKKTVDIRALIAGELPAGVVLKNIAIEPAKVEIYGEKKLIDQVEFLYTEPISMIGIDKDITKEVKLEIKDGITTAKKTITAHISVEKKK
ncbi:CdaR family protein [Dendrosporobacter sp. 1207_IL3150]|uniref:CdaR family protein n=1 Tax=Dendrosporobacter sp. 1207_IL3150 TaxID=3084054 RepID=UPI002FD926B9